jgi:hypothetical protein
MGSLSARQRKNLGHMVGSKVCCYAMHSGGVLIRHSKISENIFRGAPGPSGNRLSRLVLSGFIALNLIAITIFSLPVEAFSLGALRKLLSPYTRCVGLTEMWDTFAPDPKSAEQYLKAAVVSVSGITRIYSFPRMEELSFAERYRKERYRKFVESVLCQDCAGLWPDVAREVARRVAEPEYPPDRVILIEFKSSIDPRTGALGDESHTKPSILAEQFIEQEDIH